MGKLTDLLKGKSEFETLDLSVKRPTFETQSQKIGQAITGATGGRKLSDLLKQPEPRFTTKPTDSTPIPVDRAGIARQKAEERKTDRITTTSEARQKETTREATLKGAEERLQNLLAEAKEIERSPEPDFARQNELTKQILETRNVITGSQKGFGTGIREAFGFEPTARFGAQQATPERAEAAEQAIETARGQSGFGAGRVVGEIGKQAALYATVGAALKGTELGRALSAQLGSKFGKAGTFAADQLVDLFVDTVIQTPQELKRGDTLGKMGMNRLIDIGMNLGIGIGGEFLKSLKTADSAGFEKAVSALTPEEASKVRNALGADLQVPSTLKTEVPQLQAVKGSEVLTQPKIGPTRPNIDDFQAWRSKNFGGATGRMPEGDIKAVRDLYFEDTGKYIDNADLETFRKGTTEQLFEETSKRFEPLAEVPKKQMTAPYKNLQTDVDIPVGKPKKLSDLLKTDQVKTEIPTKTVVEQPLQDVATKAIKEEPSAVKEIISPRTPDFAEPIVGTSKSPFIERIQDFTKKDPTTAKLRRELAKLDELPTTSNEARTLAARQVLSDNFEGAVKLASDGRQFGSRIESEIGRLAVDELQRLGRHAESVELIAKMSEKFRAAGKDIQAASMWAKTSPEGMQKWAIDTLENAEVNVDKKLIQEVGEDMRKINAMTPEELAKMVGEKLGKGESKKLLDSIQNSFSFEQLKSVNTAITMQKVMDKIPVLKARKLSTAQAMSHLLNPRTFLRNIGGNTISIGAEILSRTPASVADRAFSAFTGNRTVMANMPKWKKSLNEGWKQGKRSFFEIKAGVGRGKSGKYEALFGNTFKSKIGQSGEKLLSLSLQTPDEFFKGFTKADSLFNQVQARLGKDVRKWSFDEVMEKATAEEIQQALKETEFVTFQNDSMLADLMSKTKKGLNTASTAIAGKVPGFKGMFTEDFGLGDMVLKYTRVPGNIITRGFEYSPLGYAKAADNIFNLMKHGTELTPQMQRELSMQIGRATTGTGLLALGMKLNDLNIITGAEQSKDYDVGAFNRAEGLGNYKINMSALRRLALGEDPTPQSGDTIESMNWLQPLVTPIAVGARLSQEKPGTPQEATKALAMGTFEEAMDLPTLWVIKKMFYESMSGDSTPYDVLSVPVKEAIPGFVPSTVRQLSQVADPTVRETKFGATVPVLKELTPLLGEEATGKIQSNIPFLSKKLLPKIDVLGQEQTRTPGVFPNLISPSTRTTFEPTSFGEDLRKVADLTGKTNIFPDRKPPKTTTNPRGEKTPLTPEESVRWQEVEGQFVAQEYAKLLNRVTINTEQDALKVAKLLENIKRKASERAKDDLFKNRGE